MSVKYSWPAGDAKQIMYTMVRKFREVHVNRTREVSESVPLLWRSCNRKGRASLATLLT